MRKVQFRDANGNLSRIAGKVVTMYQQYQLRVEKPDLRNLSSGHVNITSSELSIRSTLDTAVLQLAFHRSLLDYEPGAAHFTPQARISSKITRRAASACDYGQSGDKAKSVETHDDSEFRH